MAAKSTLFDPYDTKEEIESYLERLEQFLLATDVANDNTAKRKAVLLASIGAEHYQVLKDLAFPTSPSNKSFDELCSLLKTHFKPTKLRTAERYRFHTLVQKEGQSVVDFVRVLRKMAGGCEFTAESLHDNLRDRFICGIRAETTKKKLLSKEYTFEEAVKEAVAQETAVKDMKEINNHAPADSVNRLGKPKPKKHVQNAQKTVQNDRQKCFRCGMKNHMANECKYKNSTCFTCNKVGHLKSECRNKQRKSHYTSEEPEGDFHDEEPLYTINEQTHITPPVMVGISVEGVDIDFELDTGSSSSVLSFDDYQKHFKYIALRQKSNTVHAYAGSKLNVAGQISVDVEYAGQKMSLPLTIVHADKHAPPLLGRSWLSKLKLDWPNVVKGHFTHAIVEDMLDLFKSSYPDVFKKELGTVVGVKASLKRLEDASPVFMKARTVPFALRTAVENELARMETEGIIHKINYSDWATPLVCVPKPDGTVRLCGDYKVTVNKSIKIDQFPIPTPEEAFTKLAGGEKYSKIDLKCAYQQLLLDDQAKELATINTHKGLFAYNRLPFGIASSPAIWQRFMDQVLAGLTGTCGIMDDVLVTGRNDDEHLTNLHNLFARFQQFGLRVKSEKCSFMQPGVVYMGRRISNKGLQTTNDKVEAIRKAPSPRNVTELRSWLGMVNFQAKFIPNLSMMIHPLNALLGKVPFEWTKPCEVAFSKVKSALTSETILAHYDPSLPLELVVDASPYGLGAALIQIYDNDLRKPVAYASRTLGKHEQGYSQLDKEALSIMFGLKRFHTYLYGRKFTICTDHKPLERILGAKTSIPTLAAQRLQRWAVTLSAFNYEIRYITSKQNAIADALSRLPLPSVREDEEEINSIESKVVENLPVTSKQISYETRKDPLLSRVLHFVKFGWPSGLDDKQLEPFLKRQQELTVEQDCILWGMRVVVPNKYRQAMLDELHEAHVGIVRMKEIARSFVWWPQVDKDIEHLVRSCSSCQQVRNLPAATPLMPWLWPSKPWHRLNADFAEKDGQHFLIVTDAHSKWPEIVHMRSTTANATIVVLRDLFSRYGTPVQFVSDNGPQFISAEFKHFLKMNAVKQVLVAPYHAASNGAAERMVQSFKRALATSKSGGKTLEQRIACFLLTYRTTKHATTGRSPASLFLGRELRTRLSAVLPVVEDKVSASQLSQKLNFDNKMGVREMFVGEEVYVKDFRLQNKWWHGVIMERTAPKSYIILLDDKRVWKRHMDQLRLVPPGTEPNTKTDLKSETSQETMISTEPSVDPFIEVTPESKGSTDSNTATTEQSSGAPIAPPALQCAPCENISVEQPVLSPAEHSGGSLQPDLVTTPPLRRSSRKHTKPKRLDL